MGGSPAEAPTKPDPLPAGGVRASDAEREQVLGRLRDEFAAGRLSQDTFLFRMDAVLKARHLADLPPLLADLPPAGAAAAPAAGSHQEAAASGAAGALGPAAPLPAELVPAAQDWLPAGGQPSLVSRLRALPRRLRPGATQAGNRVSRTAGAAQAHRLTSGMPRARHDGPRPAPLQFPRGTGTLFSIGRDVGCDLAIADMTVSRMHARLELTTDGWLLTDLSSTNGTRVNGWLVRGQVRVRAGDVVSFGRAEYCLTAAGAI